MIFMYMKCDLGRNRAQIKAFAGTHRLRFRYHIPKWKFLTMLFIVCSETQTCLDLKHKRAAS